MNKIFETVKDGKQLLAGSFTSSYVVQEST